MISARIQQVMCNAPQRLRNKLFAAICEKNRHEIHFPAFGVVEIQRYKLAFPVGTFSYIGVVVTTETPVISLCANQQDRLGPIKTVEHPARPAFFRCAILVLVYPGVYAVLTKSLGQ